MSQCFDADIETPTRQLQDLVVSRPACVHSNKTLQINTPGKVTAHMTVSGCYASAQYYLTIYYLNKETAQ